MKLIHFEPGTTEMEARRYVADVGGQFLAWIAPLYVAKAVVYEPVEHAQVSASAQGGIEALPILNIESDGWVYGTADVNDPDLQDPQRTYAHRLLSLPTAWDYTMGSTDIVIAILDTGITSDHPEFSGRILQGYDFYNNDDDPEDDHGHGTHVTGIAAAAVNNAIGAAGVCGGCSILPVKVLNENNAGTWSGVASGIIFATDQGADVIVMSLGSTSGTQVVENAIQYAREHDVVITAAMGNTNSSRDFFPAAYDGVIGVVATDRNDNRWVLSNYGTYVDVSAPGHVIYSTFNDLDNMYDGHTFMSGTSMATPHVGGLAGLIRSLSPSLSNDEVAQIIEDTAVDLGTQGWDEHFGYGRIDPTASLAMAEPGGATGTLSGTVWIDADIDSILDTNEAERLAGGIVTLWSSRNGTMIANTMTNENGQWHFSELIAGNYRLTVELEDVDDSESRQGELILTTSDRTEVRLERGQQLIDHNLGYVYQLPSSSVGAIYVERYVSEVTLYWDGLSDLVTGIILERSAEEGEYTVVGQIIFDAESRDSRSTTSYTDVLPTALEESTVRYRTRILPGDTYLDDVEVALIPDIELTPPEDVPGSNDLIFLPLVAQ
ncbi:MAG: S8 family serine peptidase [Chloroflexota bacterium]